MTVRILIGDAAEVLREAISKASFLKLCAWQGEEPEIFYGPAIPKIERAGEQVAAIGSGP